jgi:hypothetical protein
METENKSAAKPWGLQDIARNVCQTSGGYSMAYFEWKMLFNMVRNLNRYVIKIDGKGWKSKKRAD